MDKKDVPRFLWLPEDGRFKVERVETGVLGTFTGLDSRLNPDE